MSEYTIGLLGPHGSPDNDAAFIIIEDWLGAAGIGAVLTQVRDRDPEHYNFRSSLDRISGLAVVTHDYQYEEDLAMDEDPAIPEVSRIAVEAGLPIFLNTPVSLNVLGVTDLSPELIIYGKDFDIIKRRLGE